MKAEEINKKYWELAEHIINYRMEMTAQDTVSYINDWLWDFFPEDSHEGISVFMDDMDDEGEKRNKVYFDVIGEFHEMEKAMVAKELKWFDISTLDEFYANAGGETAVYSIIDKINADKFDIYVGCGVENHDTTKPLNL